MPSHTSSKPPLTYRKRKKVITSHVLLLSPIPSVIAMTLSANESSMLALALILTLSSLVIDVVSIKTIAEYHPEERDALLKLSNSMNSTADLHKNWTGPPCINDLSRWVGIVCSNWHVVELFLEGIQLTGSLPPAFLQNVTFLTKLSFSNNSIYGQLPNLTILFSLEHVSISYNRFTGSIPNEYIDLPKLRQLELQQNYIEGEIPPFDQETLTVFNVSYNQLEGPIPATNVLQRFPASSYDHNSNLCGFPLKSCEVPPPAPVIAPPTSAPPTSPPQITKKKLQIWSIGLIVAAAALVPFLVIFVFLCYHKKVHGKEEAKEQQQGSVEWTDKTMPSSRNIEDSERTVELKFFDRNITVFDLDDLLRASAEVLGKGKLGTTYKATLESGAVIAVKRLKNMSSLSKKEYNQQMQLLGRMRHENLVQIFSFYHSKEEKLVIYEYVPNGNLFELLHDNRGAGRVLLNWSARLAIIKGIAEGLAFLHQSLPSHKVPHANLKSSNVLIHQNRDQIYHSKLTNYGFLPLLPSRKSSQELAIGRTPEFCQAKKLTHKTDVYCFGIILLEIVTGKIPDNDVSPSNNGGTDDLSDWVRRTVNNDWSTDILDVEIMATRERHEEMLKLTEIALECTDMEPQKRPKMSEVLRRIQEIEQRNREDSQNKD